MQGIDISNWQRGIDLERVPCDFVIVKATQGTSFVSDSCDRHVRQAIELGKPWGFYHYVGGVGAISEAEFFVSNTRDYFRHGIPCIDWESGENFAWGDLDYLKTLVSRVIELTGVKPLIYASATAFPWGVCDELDCGAWVAQYASNNATGYQDHPWNEGAYDCVIRQYSSAGRLAGYAGNLDLDKAYMTKEQWHKYANPGADKEEDMTQEEHDWLHYLYMGGQTDNPLSWNYNWKDGNGDYTARGGNMYNCVNQMYDMIVELKTTEAAQTEAIKALAQMQGADPDAVAKAVSDAVEAKLKDIRLDVSTEG